jgi:hypothetical protein
LQGASATEHILEEFAGKPVRAFVVWEPVLLTDWSSPSTAALRRISDSRVSQYWDKHRMISHEMGEYDRRSVVWDRIAVYPPGTSWKDRPPKGLYEGGPVVYVTEQARAAVSQALGQTVTTPQR